MVKLARHRGCALRACLLPELLLASGAYHCPAQSVSINIRIIIQKQPNNHCPTRPTMHIHSYSTLCPSDHSDYSVPPPVPTLTHCSTPLMHTRAMPRVVSHPSTVGATHASPGCLSRPTRRTVPRRPERPEAVPLSHIANAAGTADPFNNPTLRSPGDAGWGHQTEKTVARRATPIYPYPLSHKKFVVTNSSTKK